jgi:hypothetical protein
MDSSYISHFRDSTPSFFLHSYLNYIELLSILRQKYNPVTTKTDIGGEKMKREDEIEDEIQYAYCPERYVTMILTIPAFSLSKLPFRKNKQHLNKKKLKLANKQTDIQAFLLSLHSKPPFPKQRFRKITHKK